MIIDNSMVELRNKIIKQRIQLIHLNNRLDYKLNQESKEAFEKMIYFPLAVYSELKTLSMFLVGD